MSRFVEHVVLISVFVLMLIGLLSLIGCVSSRDMPQDEVDWIVKNVK